MRLAVSFVRKKIVAFGSTHQKLWMFEVLRSMGKVGMCWSQLTRVDYISPKRWAVGIKNLEKSPLRISSPIFWTLPLHLGGWNLPSLMEYGDFIFFQILFLLNLEYTWTFIPTVGIFVSWKNEITKNSTRISSIMEIFVPFFSIGPQGMFHSSSTSKIWHTST
jgi:hypothetical protein